MGRQGGVSGNGQQPGDLGAQGTEFSLPLISLKKWSVRPLKQAAKTEAGLSEFNREFQLQRWAKDHRIFKESQHHERAI